MKHIKSFEKYKNQFHTQEEVKVIKSIARRIEYNTNKFLGNKACTCNYCENTLPLYLSFYDIGQEQFIFMRNIMIDKKIQAFSTRSWLLTKEQGLDFLSEAKLHFYRYEIADVTNKYNL